MFRIQSNRKPYMDMATIKKTWIPVSYDHHELTKPKIQNISKDRTLRISNPNEQDHTEVTQEQEQEQEHPQIKKSKISI